MRKSLLFASLIGLTLVPPLAFADTVVIEPEVDTWVMEQPDSGIAVDGDIVVGLLKPAIASANALLLAVDEWMIKHPIKNASAP